VNQLVIDCAVDVVLDTGGIKGSFVLDVTKETIVLLQTFPPLDRSFLNKPILITYISPDTGWERYGFLAEVTALREGYETKGRGVPVIVARRLHGEEKCELRLHPRIDPPPSCEVFFDGEELRVVDISAGGIHVVQKPGQRLSTGVNDVITLAIEARSKSLRVDAKILRKWNTKGLNGPEHLALKFLDELPPYIFSSSRKKDEGNRKS
jgi:hypothetical protein